MAEFTYKDLKIVRERLDIKRWEVAEETGISTDTLRRWEKGEGAPSPDDVGNLERFYNLPGMWHRWMLSHYDSYRERYVDAPDVTSLSAELSRMKFEIMDVTDMLEDVERDAVDGVIDDKKLEARFRQQLSEALASIQKMLDRLPPE